MANPIPAEYAGLIQMADDWPVMTSDAGDCFTGDLLIKSLGNAVRELALRSPECSCKWPFRCACGEDRPCEFRPSEPRRCKACRRAYNAKRKKSLRKESR